MKNQKTPFFRIPVGKVDECREYFGESAESILKEEFGVIIEDDVLSPQNAPQEATEQKKPVQWFNKSGSEFKNRNY